MWPGCMRSESSTATSALARLVESRARPPLRRPGAAASSGCMRSAPARSFLRQSGLRMMVLAVNERRSPAESTNGNVGVPPGAGSLASAIELAKSSGSASWICPLGVRTRAKLSSQSSTEKTTRALARRASRRRARRAARRARRRSPRAGARRGGRSRADLADAPDRRAFREPLRAGGRRSRGRGAPARPAASAAVARAGSSTKLRAERGAARVPRFAQRRDGVRGQRAERLDQARVELGLREEAVLRLEQRLGAGGSSSSGTRS